jgi:AraC-like DNA-binding protein
MIKFSTESLPEAERFDRWREEFMRPVYNFDVLRLHRPEHESFHTVDEVLKLGELGFAGCTGGPRGFSRSRKQASDGDDCFTFCVNRRGRIELSQSGSVLSVSRTRIVLVDHGRPVERLAVTPDAQTSHDDSTVRCYNYTVPRHRLLEAAPNVQDHVGKAVPGDGRVLQYLVWYTESLLSKPVTVAEPALASLAGDHVFDLIAMLVGPTRDAAELAVGRGLRASRLMAILSYVDRNLSNSNLSPRTIADAHGISVRYVSQLMEERGETIGRYIVRSRLERVAQKLSDPATLGTRVGDIALACGFNDISSFNRAFKGYFGESPRSYRRTKPGGQ